MLDARGEPDEVTDSNLVWYAASPWKRVVASKVFFQHAFPAPHIDYVESVIDYRVPAERFADLAAFDGSVIAERLQVKFPRVAMTSKPTFLALNPMHEIVRGDKTVDEAREYYAKEFLDARRKKPTPYMSGLRFHPGDGECADPDTRMLSDEQLDQAKKEGGQTG